MKPIRSVTAAAAIGAATATIVTALAFGQTFPASQPVHTPVAAVDSPTDEPTTPTTPTTPVTDAPVTTPEPPADPVPETPAEPAPEEPPVDPEPTPTPEPTIEELGGTIRWVSRGSWGLIDNATHTPYGISRVEVRKDRVRVHFDFKASQVRDFDMSVDEGFASSNVRVGASVGLTYADVYFYMGTSKKPVNPTLLSRAGANVWLSGSFIVPPPAPPE